MPRYLPASVSSLRQGYSLRTFTSDLFAGLTVGIIALPLAMAFGIASIPEDVAAAAGLSPPAMGLYTAVVAGFLISALGGSRVQIGGPTGAFIVIVYGVAARHGYAGLATATLMAGAIIVPASPRASPSSSSHRRSRISWASRWARCPPTSSKSGEPTPLPGQHLVPRR
jgi:SulP family sulfate permease